MALSLDALLGALGNLGEVTGNLSTGAHLQWHDTPHVDEGNFTTEDHEEGRDLGAPDSVLRCLPRIRISPYDFEQAFGTECIVCLTKLSVGESAIRLPCCHLFHEDCIKRWLKNSGWCPICRYELKEKIRKQDRKPRLSSKDLEMKSVHELRCLAEHLGVDTKGCLEKSELVSCISVSGQVEIVHVKSCQLSEIAECRVQDIGARPSSATVRDMGIKDLSIEVKRLGLDASGCLEKDDLVQLVLLSRRAPPNLVDSIESRCSLVSVDSNIRDLRHCAQSHGISLAGCLERSEILQRLGMFLERGSGASIRERGLLQEDALDSFMSGRQSTTTSNGRSTCTRTNSQVENSYVTPGIMQVRPGSNSSRSSSRQGPAAMAGASLICRR